MDIVDVIVEKRDLIKATCTRYGAANVRVFGSCARDDYTKKSDVDFLIDWQSDDAWGNYSRLADELAALVGRKVDLCVEAELALDNPRILKRILQEAVRL